MIKTTCPFCTKTNLKGYTFTIESLDDEINKEPYDTRLNRVCGKCIKCPEMLKALDINAYSNLKQFCLSYVNGCGDFKSLKIDLTDNGGIITTSPKYKQTTISPPYTIGKEEASQLKARLFIQHIELWNDFYSKPTNLSPYTWWQITMLFNNGKTIEKRGTNLLPPKWNRLIKVIGRYFEWLYKDWSQNKMYELKYNHKTGERETPTNTIAPFTNYWNLPLTIPPLIRFPCIDDLKKGTRVCIYARTNQQGGGNATKFQIKRCTDICIKLSLNIVAVFEDENVSGIHEYGNGLKALIQKADEKAFTHVILTDVIRYSRNVNKAWEIYKLLKEKGIETIPIPPQKWGYWLLY